MFDIQKLCKSANVNCTQPDSFFIIALSLPEQINDDDDDDDYKFTMINIRSMTEIYISSFVVYAPQCLPSAF